MTTAPAHRCGDCGEWHPAWPCACDDGQALKGCCLHQANCPHHLNHRQQGEPAACRCSDDRCAGNHHEIGAECPCAAYMDWGDQ